MSKFLNDPIQLKEGVLLQVDSSGVGIIEESSSQKQYGFTFDKVSGYRGQPAEQVGLKKGKTIQFTTDGELIDSVIIQALDPKKLIIPK